MDNNNAELFDRAKTKVLKYILYRKRTEGEIYIKFKNEIDGNTLDEVVEKIIQKKGGEKQEIVMYLMKKGYKKENIDKAFEKVKKV